MSIVVKNDDKEIKIGPNATRYEDVEDTIVKDIKCPFCGRNLVYDVERVQAGMGRMQKIHKLSCSECCLTFAGVENRSHFKTFTDFYKFVKEKITK